MKQIRIFVLSYRIASQKVWWPESLTSTEAFRLAKVLAVEGMRPTITRVHYRPSTLINNAARVSCRKRSFLSPRPPTGSRPAS